MLLQATDKQKDQSFYLSSISEYALSKTLFPLGDLTKDQVRKLGEKWHLPTANKEESMGLCFVGEKRKFADFLSGYIPNTPGPFVELDTNQVVGQHQGLWYFTIGENARIPGMKQRMFVARKDAKNNAIYVVPEGYVCL